MLINHKKMDFHNVDKFVMECQLGLQQDAKRWPKYMKSLEYLPGQRKAGKYISLQGDKRL